MENIALSFQLRKRFNVIVKRYNTPPVANAGNNQIVNGDGSAGVYLNGINSYDPDGGHVASYAWTQAGGRPVMLHSANTAIASFIAPKVSLDTILTFRLVVVHDDGGAYSLPDFTNGIANVDIIRISKFYGFMNRLIILYLKVQDLKSAILLEFQDLNYVMTQQDTARV
jgi:hypothetical protein